MNCPEVAALEKEGVGDVGVGTDAGLFMRGVAARTRWSRAEQLDDARHVVGPLYAIADPA